MDKFRKSQGFLNVITIFCTKSKFHNESAPGDPPCSGQITQAIVENIGTFIFQLYG